MQGVALPDPIHGTHNGVRMRDKLIVAGIVFATAVIVGAYLAAVSR